jgi:tuftelin-interacting protein 11
MYTKNTFVICRYGIWADNSDEDEDTKPTFSGGSRKKGRADYTAPLGFVSAGVQKSSKEQEADKAKDDKLSQKDDTASEDEDSFRPNIGLGFAARTKKRKMKETAGSSGQMAGFRTSGYQSAPLGKGFGDWEKHTRGIGAKLLLKMGYQAGGGLGKNLEGRSTIVEAHLRKGRGAIGAYGKEKSAPKANETVDSEEEDEKEFKEKLHQWRKAGSSGSKQRVKYVYKTADQVLEEGKWRKISKDTAGVETSDIAKVKVIDMTGKQQRVLSGYHAIGAQQMPDDDVVAVNKEELFTQKRHANFDLPELRHNIDLILDKTEEDLITADRKLKHHRNRIEVLQQEEEKLNTIVEKENLEISTLEDVLALVEKLETAHNDGNLDLLTASETFHAISSQYPNEYRAYELPYMATTIVTPLIQKELCKWRPLEDGTGSSERHKETLMEWHNILYLGNSQDRTHTASIRPIPNSGEMDPFHVVMWEAWMPSVRAATAAWNTREYEKIIDFLEVWKDIIPRWMWSNILDQLVLPKLQDNVEKWDPLTDRVPIHSWLHPWLPFLGQQLEIVYPTIRNKLATCLTNWHPSDRSAMLILLPWKEVFPKGSLQAFVLKNIMPKLEAVMYKLIVNPGQQKLDEWNWVMEWKDLLPPMSLVNLLDTHFFRAKWFPVLSGWLNHNPNYIEVVNWYKGWKTMVPEDILKYPQIKNWFSQALDMMTRVTNMSSGHPMSRQPGATDTILQLCSNEPGITTQTPAAPPPPRLTSSSISMKEVARTAVEMSHSYKDLVGRRCEERGILFAPAVPARWKEGKPIYRVGNSYIYMEKTAIFVQQPGGGIDRWIPQSLNTLLDSAV